MPAGRGNRVTSIREETALMSIRIQNSLPLLTLLAALLASAGSAAAQSSFDLRSPDNRIEIRIRTIPAVRYDLLLKGRALLQDSTLSLDIDHKTLGVAPKVRAAKKRSYDQTVEPAVHQKFARIRENYNELRLEMEGGYAVVFRAYNEGAAYRFETSLPQEQVKVYGEEVKFNFHGDTTVYYPQEDSMFSHNERKYVPQRLKEIDPGFIATMPAVLDAGEGAKLAIAESDVEDYPGMWLHGTNSPPLVGTFPHYPLKEKLEKDRDFHVVEAADYIAATSGTRTFPWRLAGIVERDGDLLTNQLVWLLAKPSLLQDTSWIKPGKVAWDWWNFNNIYGVDFKAGINTQTYKYYIDFAAKYGIQYIILDEGWYKLGNVLEVVPEINMEELAAYAKGKNVGVILWVIWKSLDDQLIPALDQYAKWGVKGIKVDFMQRDDQKLINFYFKVCSETAKRNTTSRFLSRECFSDPWITLPARCAMRPKPLLRQSTSSRWRWARAATSWPCTWSSKVPCKCFRTAPRIICACRRRWSFLLPFHPCGMTPKSSMGASPNTFWWRAETAKTGMWVQ